MAHPFLSQMQQLLSDDLYAEGGGSLHRLRQAGGKEHLDLDQSAFGQLLKRSAKMPDIGLILEINRRAHGVDRTAGPGTRAWLWKCFAHGFVIFLVLYVGAGTTRFLLAAQERTSTLALRSRALPAVSELEVLIGIFAAIVASFVLPDGVPPDEKERSYLRRLRAEAKRCKRLQQTTSQ